MKKVENNALLVEGAIPNILDNICSFCEVFDICSGKYLLGHHTFWSGRPCLRQTFSHKHNFVPENQKDDGADDHDEGDGYVGEDEHNADDDDGNHDGDEDDDGDDGDDDGVTLGQGWTGWRSLALRFPRPTKQERGEAGKGDGDEEDEDDNDN